MAQKTPGDILLDAGTNELEVLVFKLEHGWFGVNVAKVREVILGRKPTEAPGMHQAVLGMINMRGALIPLVDLKSTLGLGSVERERIGEHRVIVTEFNGLHTGFIVDDVDRIHRVSWTRVRSVPDVNSLSAYPAQTVSSCTGVIDMDGTLVLMIDFESIADSITLQEGLQVSFVDNPDGIDRESKRVLLAEDSPFMRHTMERVLRDSGYTKLEVFGDGASAWAAIERSLNEGEVHVDAIVSDIEMPQMDGLHLTKRIRETKALADTPVVLFSSLVSQDNLKKGEQVGATLQIAKPELAKVVRLIDLAVSGRLEEAKANPQLLDAA
jgi:two-component system chemotaxis response regulator CheV